ncbi:FkbM family methyltransferase (plasmid) [Haladaptatus sp. SPP-AMP-3]|uniref:FkbM family methyltransferase n=1 Tax=Haladaptatus sp. SPP-AMP-3 TaxID=3121295 RepID=UPI003C302394
MGNALLSAIRPAYNRVRKLAPRKIQSMNGVAVPRLRVTDLETDHIADWKDGTVSLTRRAVNPTDTVVDVGGGWGVCTTWAARQSVTGTVHTYEADPRKHEILRETVRLNGVADRVESHETFVTPSMDLPACDVLVMDCEGAEYDILRSLEESYRPREVVVETHGIYDAPTDDTKSLLSALGYEIVDEQKASPYGDVSEDNRVIWGRRRSTTGTDSSD